MHEKQVSTVTVTGTAVTSTLQTSIRGAVADDMARTFLDTRVARKIEAHEVHRASARSGLVPARHQPQHKQPS